MSGVGIGRGARNSDRAAAMKKKMSLLSAALLGVYAVLSFFPVIFFKELWCSGEIAGGYIRSPYTAAANLYCMHTGRVGETALAVLALLFALAGIFALLMRYFGGKCRFFSYLRFAPCCSAAAFFLLSFWEKSIGVSYAVRAGAASYFKSTFEWGFYVEAVLITAASVMSALLEDRG